MCQSRTQSGRELAAGAAIVWLHIFRPVQHLTTAFTAHFQQFTVHMQHALTACAFMQIVDVLRQQQEVVAQHLLQLGQRFVRGIRLNLRLL